MNKVIIAIMIVSLLFSNGCMTTKLLLSKSKNSNFAEDAAFGVTGNTILTLGIGGGIAYSYFKYSNVSKEDYLFDSISVVEVIINITDIILYIIISALKK